MLLLCAAAGWSQQPAPARQLAAPAREIALYPGTAPGSEKWTWNETTGGNGLIANNVVKPVLQYLPADKSKAVGTAMVIAPGGGFRSLMMSYEGVDIAQRLNAIGIDAFVLKYRLRYSGTTPQERRGKGQDLIEIAGADGRQAIRLVREHASEYGVRPNRIGMIGYSAGGTVTLATVYGPADPSRFRRTDLSLYGCGELAAARRTPAVHRGCGGRHHGGLSEFGGPVSGLAQSQPRRGAARIPGGPARLHQRWPRGSLYGPRGRVAPFQRLAHQAGQLSTAFAPAGP